MQAPTSKTCNSPAWVKMLVKAEGLSVQLSCSMCRLVEEEEEETHVARTQEVFKCRTEGVTWLLTLSNAVHSTGRISGTLACRWARRAQMQ